jgi:hypothetical protein
MMRGGFGLLIRGLMLSVLLLPSLGARIGAAQADVAACPLPAPKLSAPEDGSWIYPSGSALSWASLAGAEGYQIQVDDTSDFSTPLVDATSATSPYVISGPLASGAVHWWRVRAYSFQCDWGAWSQARTFTACGRPSAPTLVGPPNDADVAPPVALHWKPVDYAVNHFVQVADDPNFEFVKVSLTVFDNQYTLPPSLDECYYWHVAGVNPCYQGDFSEVRRLCVMTPTPTPTLGPGSRVVALPLVLL